MKKSFQYRDHRGELAESLKTIQVFNDLKGLINYLRKSLSLYHFQFLDSDVEIDYYCYDHRINWNTYIVTIKNLGVIGFTDYNPNSLNLR